MFKTKKRSTLVMLLVLVMLVGPYCLAVAEPNVTKAQAQAVHMNKLLGRGVNLGNALDAPNEGQWGVTLQEEYFDIIKQVGFDSVRLPVRWSAHAMEEAPYTIDPNFMKRVTWAVDQCVSRNLPVILNIHHYMELYQDPLPHRERFLGLWKQIATRYKDYPDDLLLLEIYNEPDDAFTPALWNEWLKETLALIRQTNPDRTIVIGSANDNWITYLKLLELPEDDRNIIVTVHHYFPLAFTHQSTEWTTPAKMAKNLEDMKFIGQALPAWAVDWDGKQGPEIWAGTTWTGTDQEKKAMTDIFDIGAAWAKKHNRPLNLGEFGSYEKADMDSRVRWTRFIADCAAERSMSLHYWEFCAKEFGLFDQKTKSFRKPLLKAVLGDQAKVK